MAVFARDWNHNTHYHRTVLREIPQGCGRVLDLGSGDGKLAARLAATSAEVVAIDSDPAQVAAARQHCLDVPNVRVLQGDFMTEDLALGPFDAITALASLHHVPLEPALDRIVSLLRPGGRLIVLGVWTDDDTAWDAVLNHAAGSVNRLYQQLWGIDVMEAPTRMPDESLRSFRSRVELLLPGIVIRRRLLWRYLATWTKPQSAVG